VIAMEDKTLTCRDCGRSFVFTTREQDFYAQKGFANEPGRCPECRAARKSSRENGGYRGTYGPSREREMFPAVCAQCGKDTQVPFQPRTDKPIYCPDCFRSQRSGSYERRSFGRK